MSRCPAPRRVWHGHNRVHRLRLPFPPVLCLLVAPAPAAAQPSPVDTTGLGSEAAMHMLLEKTIFQVDVLMLDIRFGAEATARLNSLVAGQTYSRTLADSVAVLAVDARDVWARIVFKRNVSLNQFLDGVRHNLDRARKDGIVSPAEYGTISDGLPRWYAFLQERGIHSGDEMFYRILGDTLRTVFRSEEGRILLDQVDIGPERRLSVLGGYFASKSDFREGLVRSLLGKEN